MPGFLSRVWPQIAMIAIPTSIRARGTRPTEGSGRRFLRTDSPTQSDHAQAPDNREQEQEQKETDGGPVFAILFVLGK